MISNKFNWGEGARELMALLVIGLFMFAYIKNPADEMMKTALVASLGTVLGYYMGGAKRGNGPQDVNVVNTPSEPVPVEPPKEG